MARTLQQSFSCSIFVAKFIDMYCKTFQTAITFSGVTAVMVQNIHHNHQQIFVHFLKCLNQPCICVWLKMSSPNTCINILCFCSCSVNFKTELDTGMVFSGNGHYKITNACRCDSGNYSQQKTCLYRLKSLGILIHKGSIVLLLVTFACDSACMHMCCEFQGLLGST